MHGRLLFHSSVAWGLHGLPLLELNFKIGARLNFQGPSTKTHRHTYFTCMSNKRDLQAHI